MENWLIKKRKWLLGILIFVLPINLFKVFPNGGEYLSGLRVDYLIPKIYFADIAVIALLLSLVWPYVLKKSNKPVELSLYGLAVLTVGITVFLTQLFSPLSLVAVLSFTKVFLAIFLMILLGKNHEVIDGKVVTISMSFALIWQSFLSIYQWTQQQSFLPYYLSGESRIESTIFTAKSTILNPGVSLPYGSTAHPNVLAGFAAIYGLGLLAYWFTTQKKSQLLTSVLVGGLFSAVSILVLTESISAILTFFGGSYLLGIQAIRNRKLKNYNWFGLAVILFIVATICLFAASQKWPGATSLSRRVELLTDAILISRVDPITGVGANHFTVALNQLGLDKKLAPFVQPVHNTPALLYAEYGLMGLVLLLLVAHKFKYGWFAKQLPIWFLAILPIMAFDHYLLSLTPGLYLLMLTPTLWQAAED